MSVYTAFLTYSIIAILYEFDYILAGLIENVTIMNRKQKDRTYGLFGTNGILLENWQFLKDFLEFKEFLGIYRGVNP